MQLLYHLFLEYLKVSVFRNRNSLLNNSSPSLVVHKPLATSVLLLVFMN